MRIVVRVGLHGQAVDAYDFGVARDELVRHVVLAHGVGAHHGLDHGLRDVVVVGEGLMASPR